MNRIRYWLYRLILSKIQLGLLTSIGASVGGVLAYLLGYLIGMQSDQIFRFTILGTLAGGFFGAYCDVSVGYTETERTEHFISEQEKIEFLFREGRIDYRDALIKWFEYSNQLAQRPKLLSWLFPSNYQTDALINESLDDKQFIVRHILPQIDKELCPKTKELREWIPIVDELTTIYARQKPKSLQSRAISWLKGGDKVLLPKKIVKDYETKRLNQPSTEANLLGNGQDI